MIRVAAIEDNLLLADTLRAWAGTIEDITITAVVGTVADLLRDGGAEQIEVVLVSPMLRAEPDPADNVRRLIGAGHRVVVIDGSPDLRMAARILAAGAHGYLTRDHDALALAETVRAVAAGGMGWTSGPVPASLNERPVFSRREHGVLMAYASGLTLEAAARSLGISTETARTYLKRVKAKYQQAGLPVYTKLDLAAQVRADCLDGTYRLGGPTVKACLTESQPV